MTWPEFLPPLAILKHTAVGDGIEDFPGAEPIWGHLKRLQNERLEMQLEAADAGIKVARLRSSVIHFYMVTDPAICHQVLVSQEEKFHKSHSLNVFAKPLLGEGLLTAEVPQHRVQRKRVAPAFTQKRIVGYAETMVQRVEHSIKRIPHGQRFNFADEVMKTTLEIVGQTLFGTELGEESDAVNRALTISMERLLEVLVAPLPLPPTLPILSRLPKNVRGRKAIETLDEIVYKIIQQRRADPKLDVKSDALSILIAAKDEDGQGMDDKQVRDDVMTLMLAGHETTANTLSWCIHLLSQHPRIQERVIKEVETLKRSVAMEDLKQLPLTLAVIRESLRMYPPAYLISRKAIEEVVLDGVSYPQGTVFLLNVAGIHRMREHWRDPHVFDPTRFLDASGVPALERACIYFPFSVGPRVCIGNHFALMEAQLLLATYLKHFAFEACQLPQMVRTEALITLRPKGGLWVKAIPHNNCH